MKGSSTEINNGSNVSKKIDEWIPNKLFKLRNAPFIDIIQIAV